MEQNQNRNTERLPYVKPEADMILLNLNELCDEYDITITAEDLEPENFNSASAILALVEKLQDEI